MKELKTEESVIDAIASILTDYMDNGLVEREKYHPRYHPAIRAQYNIGFDHFFLGKMAQEWLNIHLPHIPPDANNTLRLQWGTAIITTTLTQMVNLWTIRNNEVHGTTDAEFEEIQKQKIIKELQQYFDLRNDCCASDRQLFPDDFEKFTSTTSSSGTKDWITTN